MSLLPPGGPTGTPPGLPGPLLLLSTTWLTWLKLGTAGGARCGNAWISALYLTIAACTRV
jgi:hypothetical protein